MTCCLNLTQAVSLPSAWPQDRFSWPHAQDPSGLMAASSSLCVLSTPHHPPPCLSGNCSLNPQILPPPHTHTNHRLTKVYTRLTTRSWGSGFSICIHYTRPISKHSSPKIRMWRGLQLSLGLPSCFVCVAGHLLHKASLVVQSERGCDPVSLR